MTNQLDIYYKHFFIIVLFARMCSKNLQKDGIFSSCARYFTPDIHSCNISEKSRKKKIIREHFPPQFSKFLLCRTSSVAIINAPNLKLCICQQSLSSQLEYSNTEVFSYSIFVSSHSFNIFLHQTLFMTVEISNVDCSRVESFNVIH